MVNIRTLDLNLLLVFDALMRERSVTGAARLLGLSQPATSNALGRLRRHLDDPLFVRTRGRMVPTPRADELGGPVREALADIERALSATRFDPAAARRTFVIAASDYAGVVLLGPLLERLAREAPGIDLRVLPLPSELPLIGMERGELDLVLGFFRKAPRGLFHQKLFDDDFVCVARAGHPALERRLSIRRLSALNGLGVAPLGEEAGLLDAALARHGLARRVALRVPQFLLAPYIIAGTDLVAVLPTRLARAASATTELQLAPLPLALPTISVAQFWHARMQHDAAHEWLRATLAEVARSADTSRPRA